MAFASVEEYLGSLDENAEKDVSGFVNFMKAEFPRIVPKISFSMPMWWVGVKIYQGYVGVSAAKKHYSVHFGEESCLAKLKEQLPDCTFGKRCVNVRYGDERAASVVKRMVCRYLSGLL